MDIGFIGLGNMGYPMARRLVEAGHRLVVYDTSGQMVSRLTSLGAVAAAVSTFGSLQGLVGCAGIVHGEKVVGKEGAHSLANFVRIININLIGMFNMIRLAAEAMTAGVPNSEPACVSEPNEASVPPLRAVRITVGSIPGGRQPPLTVRTSSATPPSGSTLASPQSITCTSPNAPTITLAGLRSRWITPLACAYATVWHT